ncbi:MAG: hypothetical protein WAX77_06300 [Methylococcaceae bacterium]
MTQPVEHLIKFYPVGNGDTSQIILHNGKRILVDFFHSTEGEDENHPKINLKETIETELKEANRDYFDVVMFTHGDRDHTAGSADFFKFNHPSYKGNGIIEIKKLYVPAAMILESRNDVYCPIIQREARYRFEKGKDILVFSKPDELKDWLEKKGLSVEERKACIIDAGEFIPDFNLEDDKVKFFVHSPWKKHVEDNEDIERNEAAIILHATFKIENQETRFFMIGDTEHQVLEEIVDKTKDEKLLQWDIYNIPHHCSYLALNKSGEKGDKETIPTEKVKKLLNYGNKGSILISSSNPIGNDYEQIQPPHVQAYNCYKKCNDENGGRKIMVTMEHPNEEKPEPIEIVIDKDGCRPITKSSKSTSTSASVAANIITSKIAPRAGITIC